MRNWGVCKFDWFYGHTFAIYAIAMVPLSQSVVCDAFKLTTKQMQCKLIVTASAELFAIDAVD